MMTVNPPSVGSAKKSKAAVVSEVVETPPVQDTPAEESAGVEEVAASVVVISQVVVTAPSGPIPGYVSRRIDVQQMTAVQSEMLARITSGLQYQGERLKDGTVVRNPQHAIKWLLEKATVKP